MTLVRVSPSRSLALWEPFFSRGLLDEAETLAGDFWRSWSPSAVPTHIHPVIDLYEEGNELVLKAEFPGMAREDIDISLQEGFLVLKAEKKVPEVKGDSFVCERLAGRYYRSIALPFDVDGKGIAATFENGLLEVRLPKAKVARSKHIAIKVK
jgi:HSP20 family protein